MWVISSSLLLDISAGEALATLLVVEAAASSFSVRVWLEGDSLSLSLSVITAINNLILWVEWYLAPIVDDIILFFFLACGQGFEEIELIFGHILLSNGPLLIPIIKAFLLLFISCCHLLESRVERTCLIPFLVLICY
jgi:hypothetical protein